MTKENILYYAAQVSRHFDVMAELDEKFSVCGYGDGYDKELYIRKECDIHKIASIMGLPVTRDESTHRVNVVVNDVCFFTLADEYLKGGKDS